MLHNGILHSAGRIEKITLLISMPRTLLTSEYRNDIDKCRFGESNKINRNYQRVYSFTENN